MRCFQLLVQFLEEVFVSDGAFVKALAQASLADGFVGDVVELGDEHVAKVSI